MILALDSVPAAAKDENFSVMVTCTKMFLDIREMMINEGKLTMGHRLEPSLGCVNLRKILASRIERGRAVHAYTGRAEPGTHWAHRCRLDQVDAYVAQPDAKRVFPCGDDGQGGQ